MTEPRTRTKYVYDRFGNRWQQNGPYTFTASFTGNNTANNNRMDGYSYDAAGNLLYDTSHYYFYDAENQLIQVDGTLGYCTAGTGTAATACYVYDAEGHRVHRTGVITDTCDGTGKRDYVFDLAGNWVGEYSSNGNGCKSEIYADSRHLVTYAGGTPLFIHSDWLGTVRLRNNATYPTYNFQTCTSLPFGDALTCAGASQSTLHFTGKERDSESGLDNFGARYDSSSMGRFMTPDWSASPSPVPYASLPYPQSLNLYSYVQNNPLKSTDPTGHCTIDGETHGWVWCAAHSLGFTETKKETAAREKADAEWAAFVAKHPEYRMDNMIRGPLTVALTMGAMVQADPPGGGGDSTVTPEESAAIDAGAAAGAEAGTSRTMVNGVPQPAAEGEIVVGPNGTAVKIPAGYVAEPAQSGGGIVYRPAGSTGDANTIRVMGPNATQGARVIIYNAKGQPIIPGTIKTGTAAQTHTPLD
ncbi:MAG TPA: RHS repeat-associated core domain-containing protein [Candidatus Sulfotelmatobacter sp.]|nr:RHS repeat-associated core domain-containing protein [Candidatus Sulfotelmatobacter sp.]